MITAALEMRLQIVWVSMMCRGLVGWAYALACGVVLAAAPVAAVPSAQSDTELVLRAQEWLEQGKGRTAYGLLESREHALAGQPAYDKLLGLAALAANEPTRAAFAFERCLAVQAHDGVCRLGMARAHIALSEVASARQELNLIAASAPPAPVQKAVADYLGVLANTPDGNQDSRLAAYLELGLGYNSNINSATSRESMALPALGGAVFALSRQGRRSGSGFNQAAFNLRYSTPIATDWRFLAEANINALGNWQTGDYNTVVSDANVGVARKLDKHQVIARLQAQNYVLGGRSYRNLVGVLGQYAYAVSDRSEFSAFVQASHLSYPDDRLRAAMRYTGGASWSQALAGDRAVVYASAYGGREDTIHRVAPNAYEYTFGGLRTGGMYLLTPRLKLEGGLGAEQRRYDGRDALFLTRRSEVIYDGYIGLDYSISRKLSVRPQYRYAHSDSNIPLRDYQRHILSVNLRYELF